MASPTRSRMPEMTKNAMQFIGLALPTADQPFSRRAAMYEVHYRSWALREAAYGPQFHEEPSFRITEEAAAQYAAEARAKIRDPRFNGMIDDIDHFERECRVAVRQECERRIAAGERVD